MPETKLAVVGGGGVGKTALTLQFTGNYFVDEYDPTVEDVYRKQVSVDGEVALLEILDTAGQEEYSSMRDQYMRNGQGFLLVYDVTSLKSIDDVQEFHKSILRVKDADYFPMVLVGNKRDMTEFRAVPTSDGSNVAAGWGCPFFEASAKLRENVDEAFFELVREVRRYAAKTGEDGGKDKRKRFPCILL